MSVFRETHAAGIAERQAWRAYKVYCLSWRRRGNRPDLSVFLGNPESRALFDVFRVARRALQAASSPRHSRNNPRFRLTR